MSWRITDHAGVEMTPVFSFRIEHAKGKPATLSWVMPVSDTSHVNIVNVWRKDEHVFCGNVYDRPTHVQDNLATWVAVAIDDTFMTQQQSILNQLTSKTDLTANLKDCVGGQAGYIHIDRVTHVVQWVSMDKPLIQWDSKGLHEQDSLYITPLETHLKGISACVKLTAQRQETGMMDVGPYITRCLGHGVETYSGEALEAQWTRLAFKALRAGYDIQRADLLPTSYQRADILNMLTFNDSKGQIVGVPYKNYTVQLLLSWAISVTTHTMLTIAAGTADERIALTIKNPDKVTVATALNEVTRWMNAYAHVRSFTAQIKFRILLTDDIDVAALDTQSWGRIMDARIQKTPFEGPIVSYSIINEGGIIWADVVMLWAQNPPLLIGETPIPQSIQGVAITGPSKPEDIVAFVKVMHGAEDQYTYFNAHKTDPFESVASGFPMTQLEIGLNPVSSQSTEQLEHHYYI